MAEQYKAANPDRLTYVGMREHGFKSAKDVGVQVNVSF
jgi:hypothetical protein